MAKRYERKKQNCIAGNFLGQLPPRFLIYTFSVHGKSKFHLIQLESDDIGNFFIRQ